MSVPTRSNPSFQEFAPMRKLFLSLAVLALVASPAFAGRYNKAVSVGEKAPVFAGIPGTTKAGNDLSLSLSDVTDKVVVVVFLANHCPVVQAYEDRLIDFTKDYAGKGVKVIGLCVNDLDSDRLPAIKAYMREKGSNYVYGYDESQAIGHAYGATNTPQFFVLDQSRTIRYMGQMDDNQNEARVTKHYLRDAVDAVLRGDTPEVTETQPRGCSVKYTK
jgi:thiol-disulfide isomerase/thioredoxin